jgi:hypothetical protein
VDVGLARLDAIGERVFAREIESGDTGSLLAREPNAVKSRRACGGRHDNHRPYRRSTRRTDERLRGLSDTLYLIDDDMATPRARVERHHLPMSSQA